MKRCVLGGVVGLLALAGCETDSVVLVPAPVCIDLASLRALETPPADGPIYAGWFWRVPGGLEQAGQVRIDHTPDLDLACALVSAPSPEAEAYLTLDTSVRLESPEYAAQRDIWGAPLAWRGWAPLLVVYADEDGDGRFTDQVDRALGWTNGRGHFDSARFRNVFYLPEAQTAWRQRAGADFLQTFQPHPGSPFVHGEGKTLVAPTRFGVPVESAAEPFCESLYRSLRCVAREPYTDWAWGLDLRPALSLALAQALRTTSVWPRLQASDALANFEVGAEAAPPRARPTEGTATQRQCYQVGPLWGVQVTAYAYSPQVEICVCFMDDAGHAALGLGTPPSWATCDAESTNDTLDAFARWVQTLSQWSDGDALTDALIELALEHTYPPPPDAGAVEPPDQPDGGAGPEPDAGPDAGPDASPGAGPDAGPDAAPDAGGAP